LPVDGVPSGMKRRTLLGAVGGGVLLGGGYLGFELFAPERATRVNEDRIGGGDGRTSGDVTVLRTGEFVGKDDHRCSGRAELARDADGLFLQFRDYERTQGPDVFCYLTPEPDPDTSAQVAAGRKVLVDGGANGGELTRIGTFAQRLPDDVDPAAVNGVAVWCDRFAVPFGAATLTEA
jgi:hypothetical protein